MKARTFTFLLVFILGLIENTAAQSASMTPVDYQRAESFRYQNLNNKLAFNLNLNYRFLPDSSGLVWVDNQPAGKTFYKFLYEEGQKTELFDHKRLAKKLEAYTKDTVDPNQLPFNSVQYITRDTLAFQVKGMPFLLSLNDYQLHQESKAKAESPEPGLSPDGQWLAYTKDYNLYIKSSETGEEYALTQDGERHYEYATYYGWGDLIEGENGDRPDHFHVDWSEDSKYLMTELVDLRNAKKMHLLDFSVDTLFRPRLLSYYRGSPGDEDMVYVTPKFFSIQSKQEISFDLSPKVHINTHGVFPIPGSNQFILLDTERGYKNQHYYLCDLETGNKKKLFSEENTTNTPERIEINPFPEQKAFTFLSERDGWQQIYIYQFDTGEITPLHAGDYYVHRTVHFDAKTGDIYFLASGLAEGSNPYHQALYRGNIKHQEIACLTPELGNHQISLSPCKRYFIDEWSTHSSPTQFRLKSLRNNDQLNPLAETNVAALLEKGWEFPTSFTFTGRDGKTILYGAVWKPSNFDPDRKYPIIDATYTGPHTQVFPERFVEVFYGLQEFAELGFIVVRINGMGTYGRSKAFHDVSYKNMGQNLLDHVIGIRHLGKTYSWADTNRVGIFGHSAGGYDAAHALLAFPDFYKVGVASSADHDFRMEKAWWPEKYMGWPIDSTYHEVSNITMAGNLKGKLLITHGGIDENVNPSATFKLAEALINEDKEFDLLIFPSQHHGYRGKAQQYFTKKRWNYFIEHLLGVEPLWDWK